MEPHIGSESQFLSTPPTFDAPGLGNLRRNIPITFAKTIMVWLRDDEKKFEDILIRFDRVHERDGQTHRQTDTA